MFKQFAVDERATRDLIEMKIAATGTSRSKVTLANDLAFQDILEGDLSYRETTEFLIARERTMERKLAELGRGASAIDRGFVVYLGASKRAHIVELERELELTKLDRDWFKREDAETRLVRGAATDHEPFDHPDRGRASPAGARRPHPPHRLHHRLRRQRLPPRLRRRPARRR